MKELLRRFFQKRLYTVEIEATLRKQNDFVYHGIIWADKNVGFQYLLLYSTTIKYVAFLESLQCSLS